MMNRDEEQKLVEVVVYILRATGGLDRYHLFKVLYFAEREHLAKWGCRITADSYKALEHGPVPSNLYDAIRGKRFFAGELVDMFGSAVERAGGDASDVFVALREPNKEYLSRSDMECLDGAIRRYASVGFSALRAESHDAAWSATPRNGVMSDEDMARAGGGSEDMVDFINEQALLDKALA